MGINLFIVANNGLQVPLGNHRCYGRAKVEQTSGKPGKIRMGKINGKRPLQSPLQGRPVIKDSGRGEGPGRKEVLQEGQDVVFGDRRTVEG